MTDTCRFVSMLVLTALSTLGAKCGSESVETPKVETEIEPEPDTQLEVADKTLSKSFFKTLPDAISQATLLDAPIYGALWGFGLFTARRASLYAVAAAGGYTLRETCKDYYHNGNKSVVCGAVDGALRHSGRALVMGELDLLTPFLGATDPGLYEATTDRSGWTLMLMEASIAGFSYLMRLRLKPASLKPGASFLGDMRFGATIGVALCASIHTAHTWYAEEMKKSIRGWLVGASEPAQTEL